MSMDLEEQYDKIYRYCWMKVHHQQEAEDITQETFLRFLENHTYREMGKQLAWLYTIARNLCIDHYRKKEAVLSGEEPAADSREEELISNLQLYQAVQELSEEDRELIFLRYVNELPAGDVAEILKISRFAVYRRLNKCLRQLRESLGEEETW